MVSDTEKLTTGIGVLIAYLFIGAIMGVFILPPLNFMGGILYIFGLQPLANKWGVKLNEDDDF